MDGWQEGKEGEKRDVFSAPWSSQPIYRQRIRGRTTGVRLEMKDGLEGREMELTGLSDQMDVGEGGPGDGAVVSNLGDWENGGITTKIQKK